MKKFRFICWNRRNASALKAINSHVYTALSLIITLKKMYNLNFNEMLDENYKSRT